MRGLAVLLSGALAWTCANSLSQPAQKPMQPARSSNSSVSQALFDELEELARIVDISYCVGSTGIHPPFSCLGRCRDFPDFELVKTWNTGPFLSDSCGFIALDHKKPTGRIILAFRGTYSIANTLVDLATIPQEYTPYPGPGDDSVDDDDHPSRQCTHCAVHSGFFTSWKHTRDAIMPDVQATIDAYPDYNIHLVGHSLGGAVALFAALEFSGRGWKPYTTTFGEPRTGNEAFVAFVDAALGPPPAAAEDGRADPALMTYRRVTHVDDPVPLLPLTEWGYRPHGGEIFIGKSSLPPDVADLRTCRGDVDPECSAGADKSLAVDAAWGAGPSSEATSQSWGWFQSRLKLWQLFFAHRDYFWRLGLCFQTSEHLH